MTNKIEKAIAINNLGITKYVSPILKAAFSPRCHNPKPMTKGISANKSSEAFGNRLEILDINEMIKFVDK